MKKGLKKVVVLAMAGVMTIAPVMTASAETVVSGGTYQMTFPDRNNGGERLQSAAHQVIVSDVPLRTDVTDQYHQQDIAAEAKAGYEMKGVYFYYPDALYVPDFWSAYAEGSGTWTPTQNFSEYGIEYGGLGKIYTFTVNMNGQDYPDCALYLDFNSYGDYSGYGDYSRCYAALRLPVGYTGNAYFQFHDYNEQGVQTGHTLDYYFSGNGETAAQETTAAAESKAPADPVRITSSEFMGKSADGRLDALKDMYPGYADKYKDSEMIPGLDTAIGYSDASAILAQCGYWSFLSDDAKYAIAIHVDLGTVTLDQCVAAGADGNYINTALAELKG